MSLSQEKINELLGLKHPEFKICTRCKIKKSRSEFNHRSSSRDGLSSQCSNCNKDHLKNHYEKNTEYYFIKNKKRKSSLRETMNEFKLKHGCSRCGFNEHPAALDFHHRSDKEFNISAMANRGASLKRIVKELEKCDILCANCHRTLTYSKEEGV